MLVNILVPVRKKCTISVERTSSPCGGEREVLDLHPSGLSAQECPHCRCRCRERSEERRPGRKAVKEEEEGPESQGRRALS